MTAVTASHRGGLLESVSTGVKCARSVLGIQDTPHNRRPQNKEYCYLLIFVFLLPYSNNNHAVAISPFY
jgi:hypothetical protein